MPVKKNGTTNAKLDHIIDELGSIRTHIAIMDERDRNTAKDIEAIQKAQASYFPMVTKHEQTLHGESGKNGIVSEVKMFRKVFYGAQAIIGAAVLFKDQFLSLFGGKQ